MSDVTPIRDYWHEANRLVMQLNPLMGELPGDDLTPGYRLTDQTRDDMPEIVHLLREVTRLVKAGIAREESRYIEHLRRHEDGQS